MSNGQASGWSAIGGIMWSSDSHFYKPCMQNRLSFGPRFPSQCVTNELCFGNIDLMETTQASFNRSLWETPMGEARKERQKNAKMVNSHRFGRIFKARITNLAWIMARIIETEPYKGPLSRLEHTEEPFLTSNGKCQIRGGL